MEYFAGRNLTGKILALFLAVILWVYVMNEQNPPVEQTISAKLEIRNVPAGLTVTEGNGTVKIRIRGPRSIIVGVKTADIAAFADARGFGEGEHSLPIRVSVPGSLEVVDTAPATVGVHLETITSRQVAVQPKFSGTPMAGVVINKVVITPSVVTISGPRSKVDAVDSVAVVVDMTGVEKDFAREFSTHPQIRGTEVSGVWLGPDKVQVAVEMLQGVISKSVDIKPVIAGEPAAGAAISRVTTSPDKVEIRGQAETVRAIEWLPTIPLDISGRDKDVIADVKLQSREGIAIEKIDQVRVTVRIAPAGQSTPVPR